MHGSKTPEDVELEFRKHYLVTGNVAGSAKAVGVPVRTGYDMRERALADESFTKARESIRNKVGEDAEQMAVCAMQLCMERLNKDPDERLDRMMAMAGEGAKVTFQDPGPQYAASLAKLIQSVIQGRRYDSERNGEVAPEREVLIRVESFAKPDASQG